MNELDDASVDRLYHDSLKSYAQSVRRSAFTHLRSAIGDVTSLTARCPLFLAEYVT